METYRLIAVCVLLLVVIVFIVAKQKKKTKKADATPQPDEKKSLKSAVNETDKSQKTSEWETYKDRVTEQIPCVYANTTIGICADDGVILIGNMVLHADRILLCKISDRLVFKKD